jgi:hypothetical protein
LKFLQRLSRLGPAIVRHRSITLCDRIPYSLTNQSFFKKTEKAERKRHPPPKKKIFDAFIVK